MKVEIITIGDEILIGQIIDTNSAWMAAELNKIGWDVIRVTTVPDTREAIQGAFDAAFDVADIVLVTGGTGPTKDDVTKTVLCEYFGGRLVFRPDILENIRDIFGQRGLRLNKLTETQAWVPDNARVLMNRAGTAPCTWFEKNGKVLVSMAGVPSEMEWLMTNAVLPELTAHFSDGSAALHHTFMVKNYSESALAEYLSDYETGLPDMFKLAYLPQPGVLRLRLTGRSKDEAVLKETLDGLVAELHRLLGKDIISDLDQPLAVIVGDLLKRKNVTLATAESCTGGAIASMITAIPGSSVYFKGGVVSYANEVKVSLLGVSPEVLEQDGAVSEEVVRQMAAGVARACNTICSVATSGVAGPDGGSVEKPVGTVWIAAKYGERLKSRLYTFGKLRKYNITRASNAALIMLIELLNEES